MAFSGGLTLPLWGEKALSLETVMNGKRPASAFSSPWEEATLSLETVMFSGGFSLPLWGEAPLSLETAMF
jgi:hypothetical protein